MRIQSKSENAGKAFRKGLLLLLGALCSGLALAQERLVENGTFDHKENPLAGWITDYAWTGNSNYLDNKSRVVPFNGTVKFDPKTEAAEGAKMECVPIVFEPGYRYSARLDVQGGPYRVYFAGYKWEPGIRPHDKPELGELRMIYKSKVAAGEGRARLDLSLPGVDLSSLAKKHLKEVRFITLYVWFMNDGYVDNVIVERVPDPSMEF
jgi:hypothetical protein